MKIKNDNAIKEYISTLLDVNDLNMSLSDMFLSIINNPNITSNKEMEILSKNYNRPLKDIYYDKISEYWDIDEDVEDNKEILNKYVYPNINELDVSGFLKNPYYQNIKIKDVKMGKYALINDRYKAFELFPTDDIHVLDDFTEKTSIGFFKKEVPFIALNENNVTWMSVNPNEVKTMEKSIANAKGDVLVLGLGLGYYPYMISSKKEVNKITIVEKDSNIIKIFKEHLLPQFENKDKISIVQEDAFSYLSKPAKHDFVFADLWHNTEDGFNLFIKLKRIDRKLPNIHFEYWLENSFYALLRRAFISLLFEQLNNYGPSEYQKQETVFDEIINRLYSKTKNLCLNDVAEIKSLLSDQKLLDLYL